MNRKFLVCGSPRDEKLARKAAEMAVRLGKGSLVFYDAGTRYRLYYFQPE
jgi:hypothetical protein